LVRIKLFHHHPVKQVRKKRVLHLKRRIVMIPKLSFQMKMT